MQNASNGHRDDRPLLWRRPWWARPGPLAAAWACVIVYGSLIPFDVDGSRVIGPDGAGVGDVWTWATGPDWVLPRGGQSLLGISFAASDLLTNLSLYMVVGVLVRLALAKRMRCAWVQIAVTAALAAVMSWSIECTQGLSPTRYASVPDWLANTSAGAMGAAAAPRLRDGMWMLLFHLHRRTAHGTLPLLDMLRRVRRRDAYAVTVAGIIGGFAMLTWTPRGGGPGTAWLPFMREFALPYDAAAWTLASRTSAYALLAGLLSLGLARHTPTRSLICLTLGAGLMAVGAEVWHGGGRLDVTEPILAAAAAAVTLTMGFLAVHGVRRGCRRRGAAPVSCERRRRGHDYRFSLR